MRKFEINKMDKDTYKALAACVSDEKYRVNMNAIRWSGTAFFATNGRRLIKVVPLVDTLGEEPGWFTMEGKFLLEDDTNRFGDAPNYERVIMGDEHLEELSPLHGFDGASSKGKDCILFAQACIYKDSLFNPNAIENIGSACKKWTRIGQIESSTAIRLDGESYGTKVTFIAMPLTLSFDEPRFTKASK